MVRTVFRSPNPEKVRSVLSMSPRSSDRVLGAEVRTGFRRMHLVQVSLRFGFEDLRRLRDELCFEDGDSTFDSTEVMNEDATDDSSEDR